MDTSTPNRAPAASSRSSRWVVGGALGLVLLVAAACSSGGSASSPTTTTGSAATPAGTAGTVAVAKIGSLGTVLVDSSGRTLYRFTPDGTGKSVCTGACSSIWPPLTVSTSTVVGTGVGSGDLGTIMRSDGTRQVTYKGMPLYTYTGDTKAGVASGQGVEGTWFVVTTSASPSASGSSSPSTTAKPSGGYGY
jgi:predicted lipoprotein with Yx(FWY)xxD motif